MDGAVKVTWADAFLNFSLEGAYMHFGQGCSMPINFKERPRCFRESREQPPFKVGWRLSSSRKLVEAPLTSTPTGKKTAIREVLLAFAFTTLACMILWRLRGYLGSYLHLGIAAVFLLTPRWLLDRRGADWRHYGLTLQPLRRGLLFFAATIAVVFPLFLVGFVVYYDFLCGRGMLPRLCADWLGWSGASPRLPADFWSQILMQTVVIALPEEFFYRGWLQGRLQDAWPNRWRVLGVQVGPALIGAAVLFGVAHFSVDGDVRRLATFFPALVFGWMRAATGSILAPVLFHAACNLYMDVLLASFFG